MDYLITINERDSNKLIKAILIEKDTVAIPMYKGLCDRNKEYIVTIDPKLEEVV